jgi:hypothetical protein
MGSEATEPTAPLPRGEALPEPTGKKFLDLEEVGALWIWEEDHGALCLIIWLSPKAFGQIDLRDLSVNFVSTLNLSQP